MLTGLFCMWTSQLFFLMISYSLCMADSANDMNTNAYKAAIHKVHERTIYEPSNALPFYVRDCGGGWACFESRHKDWRFYYLSVNTRFTEPEVVMEWSLNPMVIFKGERSEWSGFKNQYLDANLQQSFLRESVKMLSVGIMSELINLQVSGTMMHKIKCTDCTTLRKCNIIHQTGLKVFMIYISLYVYLHVNIFFLSIYQFTTHCLRFN